MGILSHFFILNKDVTPAYDISQDWGNHHREYNNITRLEAAAMLKVIRKSPNDRIEMMDEFKLLTPEDAEEWVISVPDDMVELLASVNEAQVNDWAIKCAKMTKEELNWKVADFVEVLTGLSELSKTAIAGNMKMYLWNSL